MALRDAERLDFTVCMKMLLEKLHTETVCEPCSVQLDAASDEFLSPEDITELLLESPDIVEVCPRDGIVGYPTRPLYRELGNMLQLWFNSGLCPIAQLPHFDLLDEKDYVLNRTQVIEELTPRLRTLKSLYRDWSNDEILRTLLSILKCLGRRGLLDLLGMRKTVGTADRWPPPRRTMENTFQQRHSPETSSVLTVGARALAKHSHRDQTTTWWGVCTGSEQAKNDNASKVMKRVLDGATWINIHQLPHDVTVIEARQENGYGIRWSADGLQFRGFLEPQMIDGHEIGWRH
jgi:hypothetical protein